MKFKDYIVKHPLEIGQTIYCKDSNGIIKTLLVGNITQHFGYPENDGGVGFEEIGDYEVVTPGFLDLEILNFLKNYPSLEHCIPTIRQMMVNVGMAAIHDSKIREELFATL